jgi:hypothetical protein
MQLDPRHTRNNRLLCSILTKKKLCSHIILTIRGMAFGLEYQFKFILKQIWAMNQETRRALLMKEKGSQQSCASVPFSAMGQSEESLTIA